MPGYATHYRHISGNGLVTDKPCILKSIMFTPNAANDWADIYDGVDTTSGTKVCRILSAVVVSWCFNLSDGILMGRGIYIDGLDDAVETTVAYVPLADCE